METDYSKVRGVQREEAIKSNELLNAPADLNDEERTAWEEIASLIIAR